MTFLGTVCASIDPLDFGPDLVTETPDPDPPLLEQESLDQTVEDGTAI